MAGSIRVRLLIAAALSVIAALAIAGIGLTYLFERHVERRIDAELTNHMNQLIAGLEIADDGASALPSLQRIRGSRRPSPGSIGRSSMR